MVSVFFSFEDFFLLFKEGFGELLKFSHRGLDLWPNLFMSVGELKHTNIVEITKSAGGIILMLTAFGGWCYNLRMILENPRQNRSIDTIISVYF